MTETELAALCAAITPAGQSRPGGGARPLGQPCKAAGRAGRIGTTIEDAAALTGSAKLDISRRAVLVLCADKRCGGPGVSQTDSA